MPPGQAKKLYRIGQRFPLGYGNPWSYNQIPYDLRPQYDLDRSNRYYYGDGYIYGVDPRTRWWSSRSSSASALALDGPSFGNGRRRAC